MKRYLFMLFAAGFAATLVAADQNWVFNPTTLYNDWYLWNNSANWLKEGTSETGLPGNGDRVVVTNSCGKNLGVNLNYWLKRIYFAPNAADNLGYAGPMLMESDVPGDGLIWASTKNKAWWFTITLDGTVTLDINSTSSIGVQSGIFGRSASQKGRFVKTGAGILDVQAKCFTNIVGGVFRQGKLIYSAANRFHETFKDLYFDGDAASAYFSITGADQDIVDGHLHSTTNTFGTTDHGLTDDGNKRKVTLSGDSPVAEQYYEGGFHGSLSFCWNPNSSASRFTVARSASTTTGSLIVDNGVFAITEGASFASLSAVEVNGGVLEIASDAGALAPMRFQVARGAKVRVGAGKVISLFRAHYAGQPLPSGEYTAASCEWVEGDGKIVIDCYQGTYADEQLILDVDEGESRTMAEAIADYNEEHGTSYDISTLNGGSLKNATLVKQGQGTLVADTVIPLFEGIVHVEQGTIDVTITNALGITTKDACPFYVHDGAMISMSYPKKETAVIGGKSTTVNISRLGSRIVHIAGTGVDGKGALRAEGVQLDWGTANMFGKTIMLDADATVYQSQWYTHCDALYLQGYTLTAKGVNAKNHDPVYLGAFQDDGRVKLVNCDQRKAPFTINSTNPENMFEFGDLGGFRFWGCPINGTGASSWKFVFNGSKTYLSGDADSYTAWQRDSGNNSIGARVFVTNEVHLINQGNSNTSVIYLRGPVTGTGGFWTSETSASEPNYLHLMNSANSFTGEIRVHLGIVYGYENGSLPETCSVKMIGDYDLKKGSSAKQAYLPDYYGVELCDPGCCSLPALTVSGSKNNVRVQGGRGSWRSIVKEGTNTFPYNSEAGSPLLDVRAGVFRLPRGAAPGVWEGLASYSDANAANAAVTATTVVTNYIARGPITSTNNVHQAVWKPDAKKLFVYTGYLWNRTESAQAVTFATSFKGVNRLLIDGEPVVDAAANALQRGTVTLTPGPHAFEFRVANASARNPSAEWPGDLGVAVAVGEDVTDKDSFVRLVDPGDGSIFTRTTDAVGALPAFETISLAEGATFDLNGNVYRANTLVGSGTVTSTATDDTAAAKLVFDAPFTVNAASTATPTVAVPVELGENFRISVTNVANWAAGRHRLLVVSGDEPIVAPAGGIPVVTDTGDYVRAYLTDGGKTLELLRTGLMLYLR